MAGKQSGPEPFDCEDPDTLAFRTNPRVVRNGVWWATPGSMSADHFVSDYNRDEILAENPKLKGLPDLNRTMITLNSQEGLRRELRGSECHVGFVQQAMESEHWTGGPITDGVENYSVTCHK